VHKQFRAAQLARARALVDAGTALAAILRERLYVNLGHATFASYLAANQIGRSQAFKWISLAASSTAARIADVGVEAACVEVAAAQARTHPPGRVRRRSRR
jgi:hypothetical protein